MTETEQHVNDIVNFMEGGEDVGLSLEFPLYLVMSHYHLGPKDLEGLSTYAFSLMFRWAMAQKKLEADQMEKSNAESMSIQSTNMSRPMPHSEGW